MSVRLISLIFLILIFSLTACTNNSDTNVPIIDVKAEHAKAQGYYTVQPGETLYFIAWRLNLDYHDLAAYNNLSKPYHLYVGERLRLSGKKIPPAKIPPFKVVKAWQWPVNGKLWHNFSPSTNGIDILAPRGTPVRAAAAGEVVYSGNGIRGYGNLIIIEHNAEYMTAYAHSDNVYVQEGAQVYAGQIIATVGSTGANQVFLHFELRKRGHAVNPLKYLS